LAASFVAPRVGAWIEIPPRAGSPPRMGAGIEIPPRAGSPPRMGAGIEIPPGAGSPPRMGAGIENSLLSVALAEEGWIEPAFVKTSARHARLRLALRRDYGGQDGNNLRVIFNPGFLNTLGRLTPTLLWGYRMQRFVLWFFYFSF